jgi:hypothetical protein
VWVRKGLWELAAEHTWPNDLRQAGRVRYAQYSLRTAVGDAGCAWRLARQLWTPMLVDERRGWGAAEARPRRRPLRTQPPDDAVAEGEDVEPRSAEATTGGGDGDDDDDGCGGGGEGRWVQVRRSENM